MKTKIFKEWFAESVVIKHRFPIIALIMLLAFLSYFGMQRVVMDNSNDALFSDNAEVIQANETYKSIFGNEDFVFILVESRDVFHRENLESIRLLGDELEDRLPFTRSVTSLTHMEFIETIDDELFINDLIPDPIPQDQEELNLLRAKILAKTNYVDRIITRDSRCSAIIVEFDPIPEEIYLPKESRNSVIYSDQIQFDIPQEDLSNWIVEINPRSHITPAIDSILEKYRSEDFKLQATGVPVVDYRMDQIGNRENRQAFLISLVIALLLLIFIFRDFVSVVAPVIVMIAATIITYGITGWLGIPISIGSVIIACLLLILSVSYSIHVINHFRRSFQRYGSVKTAVVHSIKQSIWPCFITASTTVIGFLSFLFVPLVPMQNLGIICAIGVTVTYLLVMVLVPALMSFKRDKKRMVVAYSKPKAPPMEGLLSRMANYSQKSMIPTGLVIVGLLVLFAIFRPSILVDTDFVNMYGEQNPFVKETTYITDRLGALYSYEVLIELPESGQGRTPEVLKGIEAMEERIDSFDTTKRIASINNLVKEISMTMNQNDEQFYSIPEDPYLLSQYLLLYEISGGEELSRWIDYDERYLRISVQANRFTTTIREDFREIEAMGNIYLPEGTKLTITGDMAIMMETMGALVDGQLLSVAAALIGISLMMVLILRSLRVGLLSMIPNIFPLIVVLAMMAFFKISLNMQTIMVAPLLIGIAVDDTVHYFLHFRKEFNKTRNYAEANKQTFRKVGGAIVFTSVILSMGFLSFAFSSIKSITQVAILLSSGIFAALLADLWITPGLFVRLEPFGKEDQEVKHIPESITLPSESKQEEKEPLEIQ